MKVESERMPCPADREPKGIREWIDYIQKNKPQTNALGAGVMVMLFSGQNIGWGICNNHLKAQPWAGGYEDNGTVFWAIISFFIAAIVGLFIAAIAVNKLKKLSIYMIASLLAVISSACFVMHPDNIYFITPARAIAGLAYGLVYPVVLIHACEVSVQRLRGMVVASIHFCLIIGVYTASSCLLPVYSAREYKVDPTRLMGINGLIYAAIGVLIAVFFNRESPIYLIKKHREGEALQMMVRLRSESHETSDIRRDFDEFKAMVAEDANSSCSIFNRKNRWPLLLIVVMKIVFVASFNMPLNLIWLEALETKFYDGNNDASGMFLTGTRWGVLLLTMFVIDVFRKKLYMTVAFASALLLLATSATEDPQTLLIFALAFQATSGAALGAMSDIYATEAFNTKRKPLSIAFASSIELLLQIFFVVAHFYMKISSANLLTALSFTLAIGIGFCLAPDTSRLSLRAARNRFDS